MNKKQSGFKRLLSLAIAFCVALSALPLSVFADSWEAKAPVYIDDETALYEYKGVKQLPSSRGAGDRDNQAYIIDHTGKQSNKAISLYQYQLTNTTNGKTLWTYCSDFHVEPTSGKTYTRISVENVGNRFEEGDLGEDFFSKDPVKRQEQARKLRAIILNSDLFLENDELLAQMRDAGAVNPNIGEAQAATQLAIWKTVNNASALDEFDYSVHGPNAMENPNVKAYLTWLLKQDAASDVMAEMQITSIQKTPNVGASTYDAVITYEIVGKGVADGEDVPALAATSAEAMKLNTSGHEVGKIPAGDISFITANNTVTIRNIPEDNSIKVTLSGVQKDVKCIYLFVPGNRESSQTLVSVMSEDRGVNTEVVIDAPNGSAKVNLAKRWYDGTNPSAATNPMRHILPNGYVSDRETLFRFFYHDIANPTSNMNNTQAAPDLIINGNGSTESGYSFQLGQQYRVAEYMKEGTEYKYVEGLDKYFKVPTQGVIQWTDKNGNVLGDTVPGNNYFFNPLTPDTGTVTITKAYAADVEAGIRNSGGGTAYINATLGQEFTIKIDYSTDGVNYAAYSGASYSIVGDSASYTVPDTGIVKLKEGKTLLLENVPKGWTIRATEQGSLPDAWVVPGPVSATVDENNKVYDLTVTNGFNTGSLKITKELDITGDIKTWADLGTLAGTAISFKIDGPSGFTKTVTLDYSAATGNENIVLTVSGLPYGSYTVTEINSQTAYSVAVNGSVGAIVNVEIESAEKDITYTNKYTRSKANLTITKKLEVDPNLTGVTIPTTFSFTVKGSDGKPAKYIDGTEVGTITLTPGQDGTDSVILENLVPDTYTITEDTTASKEAVKDNKGNFYVTAKSTGVADTTNGSITVKLDNTDSKTAAFTNQFFGPAGTVNLEKAFVNKPSAVTEVTFTIYDSGGNKVGGDDYVLNADNRWMKIGINLPAGNYTITETITTPANYDLGVKWIGGTGADTNATYSFTVTNNGTVSLKATNTYTQHTGEVVFGKSFVIPEGAFTTGYNPTASATFTVKGLPSGTFSYGVYSDANCTGSLLSTGTVSSSSNTISLTHGQYALIKGVPVGTIVTVTETANSLYSVEPVSGQYQGQITAKDQRLNLGVFTNTHKTVNLTINKTFPKGNPGVTEVDVHITGPTCWDGTYWNGEKYVSLTRVGTSGSTYKLTLTGGGTAETWTAVVLQRLPAGNYVVTENLEAASLQVSGYTLKETSGGHNGTITTNAAVLFKNEYTFQAGSGTITKTVDQWADPKNVYRILISFNKGPFDGDLSDHVELKIGGVTISPLTWEDSTSFYADVKAGQSIQLTGVPHGVTVTATETHVQYGGTGDFVTVENRYTAKYRLNKGTASDVPVGGVAGDNAFEISIENITVVENNGDIKVTKAVSGAHDPNETFTFYLYVESYKTDATGTRIYEKYGEFTLKAGQTGTFPKAPAGLNYYVEEIITSNPGYTTSASSTYTGAQVAGNKVYGVVPADKAVTHTITFTNTRQTYGLTVSKIFEGSDLGWDDLEDDRLVIEITGPSYWGAAAVANGLTHASGNTYILYLDKVNASKTLIDLPYGSYKVEENPVFKTGVNEAAYTPSNSYTLNDEGTRIAGTWVTGTLDQNYTVAFTNTYTLKTSFLTFSKLEEFNEKADGWPSEVAGTKAHSFLLQQSTDGGTNWTPASANYIITHANATTTSGSFNDGVFTLKGEEKIVFTGLATVGVMYQITETAAASYSGYTFGGVVFDKQTVSLVNGDATVSATNTYTRILDLSLTVNKALVYISSGNAQTSIIADMPQPIRVKTFVFDIYYKLNNGNWHPVTTVTLGNGTYSEIIGNLPAGVYKVQERNTTANSLVIDGYQLESGTLVSDVTLADGIANEATITNTYSRLTGDLTVHKSLAAGSLLGDRKFFTFQITGPDSEWVAYAESDPRLTQETGLIYRFTLDISDSDGVTFEGLPGGEYTIAEVTDVPNGYVLSVKSGKTTDALTSGNAVGVVVGSAGDATAYFVNSYRIDGSALVVSKLMDFGSYKGTAAEALFPAGETYEFTFKIKGAEGWNANAYYGNDLIADGDLDADGAFTFTISYTVGEDPLADVEFQLPKGEYQIIELTDESHLGKNIGLYGTGFTYTKTVYDSTKLTLDDGDASWKSFTVGSDQVGLEVRVGNYYLRDSAEIRVTKLVGGYAGDDMFAFMLEQLVDEANDIWRPVSALYTVVDSDDNPVDPYNSASEWGSIGQSGKFALKAGHTAVISGLDQNSTFRVREMEVANLEGVYTLTDVTGSVYDSNDGSSIITLSADTEIDSWGLASGSTGQKLGDNFPGLSFTFTNARLTGSMSISKAFDGVAFNNEAFQMNIMFTKNSSPVSVQDFFSGITANILVDGEDAPLVASFRLSDDGMRLVVMVPANKTVVISGLPAGLGYEVTETYYTVEHDGREYAVYDNPEYNGKTGTVASDDTKAVTVTNKRLFGSVMVIKRIISAGTAPADDTFSVKVEFDIPTSGWTELSSILELGLFATKVGSTDVALDADSYTLSGGKLTVSFTLENGQTATISKVPVGLTYTITEELSDNQKDQYNNRYTLYDGFVNPKEGIDKEDDSVDSVTVNNYYLPKNSLSITKHVSGSNGSRVYTDLYQFSVGIFRAQDNEMYGYFQDRRASYIEQANADKATTQLLISELESRAAAAGDEFAALETEYNTLKSALEGKFTDESGVNVLLEEGKQAEFYEICEVCLGTGEVDVDAHPCTACPGEHEHVTTSTEECDDCAANALDPVEGYICPNENCVGGTIITTIDCADCLLVEACDVCDDGIVPAGTKTCENGCFAVDIESTDVYHTLDQTGIDAYVQGLVDDFEAEEAVKAKAALDDLNTQLTEAEERLVRIDAVLAALRSPGTALVVFDEDYNIRQFEENAKIPVGPEEVLPIIILDAHDNPVQWEDEDGPARFSVDTDENGEYTGYYSVWLADGETAIFSQLPAGAVYEVKELVPTGTPESIKDITVAGIDNSTVAESVYLGAEGGDYTDVIRGTIAEEDSETENKGAAVYEFYNIFEKVYGSITVSKIWVGRQGSDTIVVELHSEGKEPLKTTLSEENGWSDTFDGLDLDATYTLVETTELSRYNVEYSHPDGITLTYLISKGSMSVTNTRRVPPPEPEPEPETENTTGVTSPETTRPTEPTEPTEPGEEIIVPETPTVALPPEEIIIDEEEQLEEDTPLVDLPATGGTSAAGLLGLFGSGLLGLGALLGKKKKDD